MILYFSTSYSKKSLQRKSLRNYELVLTLIRLIQQHRGLSQGVISGEKALFDRLNEVQVSISRSIDELSAYLIGGSNERWVSFLDHWARLSHKSVTVEGEDSFKQHNQMISNLMYMSEDICLNSDLGHGDSLGANPSFWHELLVLSESLGQSRALGTAVLIRGDINYIEQIRAKLSVDRIEHQLSFLQKGMPLDDFIIIKERIEPVLGVLKRFLVDASESDFSGQEFFAIATSAIVSVSDLLEQEIQEIKRELGCGSSSDRQHSRFSCQREPRLSMS